MKNPAMRTRRLVRTLVAAATAGLIGTTGAAYGYVAGNDTSHYQHNPRRSPSLDWKAVAGDGVKFAFLKATEGSSYTDPYFKADWAATASNGIYRGAYHFARPSRGSAKSQADYFVSRIGPQRGRGTLPPVLDLEATGGLGPKALITWTRTFLQEVQARTGRDPIIYVSPYFWIDHLANSTAFHNYPLWVAHYGVSQPMVPGGWPTWSFWQTTSSGRISGISGNVDKDLFNGSMIQLQKFALAYTRQGTRTTFSVANAAPHLGDTVRVSGRVTDLSGNGVRRAPFTVQESTDGGRTWKTLMRYRAGRLGRFSNSVTVDQPARYRATFQGTDAYRASTSTAVPVTITPYQSDLTLSTPTSSTKAGTPITLSGSLQGNGDALAGRNISLFARYAGTSRWTRVSTVSTDSTGAFEVTRSVLRTARYRARYAGETAYAAAAATTGTVTVTPNATTLGFGASNPTPYRGGQVSLRGQLTSQGKPVASRSVTIQRQTPGTQTWSPVSTVRTDSTGHYSLTRSMTDPASYRAVYNGEWLYAAAVSDPVAVSILPPNPTRMTLTAGRTEIRSGRSTTLRATLTTRGHGLDRVVKLFERHRGQTHWHYIYKTTTRLPDGDCRIVVSPTRTTVYQLRFAGGPVYAASQHQVRVSVR